MAEAAPANTRPARTPRKTAPAKATPAKAAPAAAKAPAPVKTDVDRFKVELVHQGATARYEKFGAPDDMKGIVVGTLYTPLGTERVAVMVIGAGGDDSE